jgi:hypothetical protein
MGTLPQERLPWVAFHPKKAAGSPVSLKVSAG